MLENRIAYRTLANETVIAMKECLNCTAKFQERRSTAKFCSNKCRAAYNRGNPTQTVSKVQLQVLYNEMLELIKRVKSEPQRPFYSTVTKEDVEWGQVSDPVTIRLKRPFLTLQTLVNECESQEQYEPLRKEIEEADHLSDKEKVILLRKR